MTLPFNPQAALPIYATDIMLAANQRKSLLENTVTKAGIDQGNSYTFEVADSEYTYAKPRAANGNIPVGNFDQNQLTVAMTTSWAKREKSYEELKGSQGDIKRLMVDSAAGEISRTVDKIILDELDAEAAEFDAAVLTNSLDATLDISAQLMANKFVANQGSVFAVIGPRAYLQMIKNSDFKTSLIAGSTPLKDNEFKYDDTPRVYDYAGIFYIFHPALPGVGTVKETNFVYHKTAIASVACIDKNMLVETGTVPGQAKYFCNVGLRTATKALQTTGLFKFYS